MIKVAVSCSAIAAFILGCTAWGRLGHPAFPYGAGAVWLLLTLAVSRLWHRELRHVLLTVGGAVGAATAWSITLVDFPPWFIAQLPVAIAWLVVLCPVLVAGVTGARMNSGYLLSGGLTLLLGGLAVLPMLIWNVQTHPNEICADVTYTYPYVTPAYGLGSLAIVTGLGVGGAALGHLVRGRR